MLITNQSIMIDHGFLFCIERIQEYIQYTKSKLNVMKDFDYRNATCLKLKIVFLFVQL